MKNTINYNLIVVKLNSSDKCLSRASRCHSIRAAGFTSFYVWDYLKETVCFGPQSWFFHEKLNSVTPPHEVFREGVLLGFSVWFIYGFRIITFKMDLLLDIRNVTYHSFVLLLIVVFHLQNSCVFGEYKLQLNYKILKSKQIKNRF